MKPSSLLVLLALVPLALGDHIDVSSYPFSATLRLDPDTGEPLYQLYWNFDNAEETVQFSVRVKTTGWVGFGISPDGGMIGSDVVIGWVSDDDGTAFFNDRYAEAEATPPIDASQDWILLEADQSDGYTSLTFIRKFYTCDDFDRDIAADTARVVFSWNPSDPASPETPSYHGASRRGTVSLNIRGGLANPPDLPDDVDSFNITVTDVPVPDDRDTLYFCQGFKLPQEVLDQKRYIIKNSPLIAQSSLPYVHHMLFYQCEVLNETTDLGPGGDCEAEGAVSRNIRRCRLGSPIVAVWAVGGNDFIYPEGVAFPIGGSDEQFKYIVVEMHYNNPSFDQNVMDSSGMQFFYTSMPPENEAAIMEIGHTVTPLMIIPPKSANFTIFGMCKSNCTEAFFPPTGINVFANMLHTHTVGSGLTLQHLRPSDSCPGGYQELKPVDENLMYDFDLQQVVYLPQEVNVLPGDVLLVKCYYDTENANGVTLGGLSTQDEMCLSFVVYYPRIPMSTCHSYIDPSALFGSFLTKHFSDFSPQAQQAFVTQNFSAFGDTIQEVLTALFNELQWTPEQISDFQDGNENGAIESFCTSRDEDDEVFSSTDTLPDVQCPYVPEEQTCTPLVIDMPGAAVPTAAGMSGLMALALATLCTLIF